MTSLVGLAYGRLRARLGHATLLRISMGASAAGFLLCATVSQPVVLLLAPALFGPLIDATSTTTTTGFFVAAGVRPPASVDNPERTADSERVQVG